MTDSRTHLQAVLQSLGLDLARHAGSDLAIRAPRDGVLLASLQAASAEQAQAAIAAAQGAGQA